MKIKQGEHMSYPPKFEDIEALQLTRELARKVNKRKATLEPLNLLTPEPLNP